MPLTWSPSIAPIRGSYGAVLQNTSVDDNFLSVGLSNPFFINGVGYNNVFISSNTYLTFQSGSGVFSGLSMSIPAQPTMFFGAGDNSSQYISRFKIGDADMIHYEGTAATSGSVGSPNILIEWYFWPDGKMQVVIAQHNRVSGLWGISNGAGGTLAAITPWQNSSYTFETADLGLTWLIQQGSFIDSTQINSPTVGMSIIPNTVYASKPGSITGPGLTRMQLINVNVEHPVNYRGSFKLVGTTKRSGSVPFASHVLVYPDDNPSTCIASVRTDDITGTFIINDLAPGKYMVVGIDASSTYNDMSYDHVTAVPM